MRIQRDLILFLSHVVTTTPLLAYTTSSPPSVCTPQNQPNPIATQYPNLGTGAANGTIAIIPIDYSIARSIVPSRYPILTHAYEILMPNLPKSAYPMYIDIALDYGLQRGNLSVPSFTRASLVFPFIDRLNDGHTSFRYGAPILITDNPVVYTGSVISQETFVGTFDPPCAGYASAPNSPPNTTYVKGWNGTDQLLGLAPSFDTRFHLSMGNGGYDLDIYKNITNQVLFGSGAAPLCDHFQQLFNSSISEGTYPPRFVTGSLTVRPPYFPYTATFRQIHGVQLDAAFIETPAQNCSQFSGYSGTGIGD